MRDTWLNMRSCSNLMERDDFHNLGLGDIDPKVKEDAERIGTTTAK